MTSLVGLCVTLLLAAASASSSPAALEEAPNQQASFEASHPDPADLYDPAVLLDNYTATLLPLAWELQMGPDHARRLTAVSSPPPPPNPLKLKDGSTCCPTKTTVATLPATLPGDATLTYPANVNARCKFTITGSSILQFSNNFVGVYALTPPAYSLQLDPNAIYLVSAGGIVIYDSTFNNIAVGAGFGFLTITEGTTPVVIQNSAFTGITTCVNLSPSSIPTCFPALVASQPTVRIWA
ncbi:hypothetical protein WJX74_000584 [Apatococcus lobatus]|uniref:Uncharacterized protein n=1 Tax=Apatococcus lobatus TaxID=904363 RepID=A0AAW1SEN5_9CHLO